MTNVSRPQASGIYVDYLQEAEAHIKISKEHVSIVYQINTLTPLFTVGNNFCRSQETYTSQQLDTTDTDLGFILYSNSYCVRLDCVYSYIGCVNVLVSYQIL